MSDDIIHSNQATFLAARALEAVELGPPVQPPQFALPGAKMAVEHDRLLAYHAAGLGERHVVDRANTRWAREHSAQVEQHREWVRGPYVEAVVKMAERAAREAAKRLEQQAAFERFMAEHGDGE